METSAVAGFQRFRDGSCISFPFMLSRFALNADFTLLTGQQRTVKIVKRQTFLIASIDMSGQRTDVFHVFHISTAHFPSLKTSVLERRHSRCAQGNGTVVPKCPRSFITFQSRMFARMDTEAEQPFHPVATRHTSTCMKTGIRVILWGQII